MIPMLLIVKDYKQTKNKADFATKIDGFKDNYYNALNNDNKQKFKQYCAQYADNKNTELKTASNLILKL